MTRRLLKLDSVHPYQVTARSNNRDWFDLPMEACWRVFATTLSKTSDRYDLRLHAFLLMSNHFHLLISTPNANLGSAMRYLMTESSRRIARASGRINHVYGGRYKWSLLTRESDVAYAYKYLIRNPVRARMTDRVEQYPFSTFTRLLVEKECELPVCERIDWSFLRCSLEQRIEWLNQPTPKEEYLIGLALRRHTFAFSRDKKVQLKLKRLSQNYLRA